MSLWHLFEFFLRKSPQGPLLQRHDVRLATYFLYAWPSIADMLMRTHIASFAFWIDL